MVNFSRPSLDQTLMNSARNWATRSTCSRLSVGAVLARGGREFSQGYNGAARGLPHCEHSNDFAPCARAVHAEENAILSAAYHGVSTLGASIFCTHAPCEACASRIVNAGITEVVYAETFRTMAGVGILKAVGITVRQLEAE